jgi:CheY-like chemotaxis protein
MVMHEQKSILVVEDDDTCREMTRNVLRAAGFRVVCARDFYEAIAVIEREEHIIDIALVDVRMPPGTPHGISFARMAQQRRPWLKVIFMSGNMESGDFKMFDASEPFLRKPFAPHHLLTLIERAAA